MVSSAQEDVRPASKSFKALGPNPALYTDGTRQIYLEESPTVVPTADECVVRMRTNGICGSDVHFWKAGKIGNIVVDSAYVLGHEGAGVVVWVGFNVNHLSVGDRVAVESGVSCHHCNLCSTGVYNLCQDVKFVGAYPYHGSIRRYHSHPGRYLHKLPASVTYTEGALLEPLSVALHAFERCPARLGESVVICGAGPIGLIALLLAKASGVFPILITDVDLARLEFAKQLVPGVLNHHVLLAAQPVVEAVMSAGGNEPRIVYECTGVQSSIVTATYIPRPSGEIMVIGVGRDILNELPFMHISLREIDIKFINRYDHSPPTAIRLLQSGNIDSTPLVTHRFPLEDAVQALTLAADRNS